MMRVSASRTLAATRAAVRCLSFVGCFLGAACEPSALPPASSAADNRSASETSEPDAWRAETPEPGTPVPVAYPKTDRLQLPSGLSILMIHRPSTTLSLGITCKAGSAYDPLGQAGLSALVARMLTEGTTHLDADALAIAAERLGANLESTSSDDSLTLRLEVLPESADAALSLLADVIQHPAFRLADLNRVKREWLDNLSLQREDASTLATLVARRALLGVDAGQNPLGTPAQISRLNAAELRRFQQNTLVPARCALLAVGPLTPAKVQELAQTHLATWTARPGKFARRKPRFAEHSRVLFVDRPDAVQTSLLAISSAPGRTTPGHEARRVIDNYFGGLFTSRINMNLREEHAYTYGASSQLNVNPEYGVWSVQTDVKSEATMPAVEQLLRERTKLVDGTTPGADEVERSKSDLIHSNAARLEHTNALFGSLQTEFSQELEPDYFATLGSRFSDLSISDLKPQIPAFSASVTVLVLVGPAAALKDATGWLGAPIQTIDAAWLDAAAP